MEHSLGWVTWEGCFLLLKWPCALLKSILVYNRVVFEGTKPVEEKETKGCFRLTRSCNDAYGAKDQAAKQCVPSLLGTRVSCPLCRKAIIVSLLLYAKLR